MTDEPTNDSEGGAPRAREPKVIKRYTNRKLYDTVESRYVTLDEIAEMIKSGAEVKIVDNRTKEDLTSVTLAQILLEEEKKTSKMNLKTLLDLIRHGGERAQQLMEDTQAEIRGRVEAVRHAAEQKMQSILSRGQQTSDRARELVATSQEAVLQLQRKLDERIRAVLEGMASLSELRKQMTEIASRVEEMEKRLRDLEKSRGS